MKNFTARFPTSVHSDGRAGITSACCRFEEFAARQATFDLEEQNSSPRQLGLEI
jgi:hypothetical protein